MLQSLEYSPADKEVPSDLLLPLELASKNWKLL